MAYQSNKQFYIKETISIADATGSTFKIGNDFELDTPVETGGKTVSIVIKNGTQIERMEITATGGVATIVKRGLTAGDEAVEDSNLNKPWNDGAIAYITALAFDLPDLGGGNTWEGTQVIDGDVDITGGVILDDGKGLEWDTDFYIKRDGNDMLFKDKANPETSLTDINALSGADTKVSTSATDTTTGTLEDKVVMGDGVTRTINNPGGAETYEIDIDLSDTNTFSDVGVADRAIITDGSGNLFQATETVRGGVEKATDIEANEGLDTERYITSAQANKTGMTVSDTEQASSDIEKNYTQDDASSNGDVTLFKGLRVGELINGGTVRITYEQRGSDNGVTDYYDFASTIRVDGVEVSGPTVTRSNTYSTVTADVSVDSGSSIYIYVSANENNNGSPGGYIKNFKVKYTETVSNKNARLLLD